MKNANIFILNPRKGFTLLEVIIVLFLITLMLGIAAVFFAGTTPSNRLNTTAREMSAAIRHANSLAKIHGEIKTITIDLDAKQYGIERRRFKKIPQDISIRILDPFDGSVDSGKYRIVFHSAGSVESGRIVLYNNKRSISIDTDPIVGAVIIR
jgi:prepilin-type N-terminal cleavage/methylation domain-containing protein